MAALHYAIFLSAVLSSPFLYITTLHAVSLFCDVELFVMGSWDRRVNSSTYRWRKNGMIDAKLIMLG